MWQVFWGVALVWVVVGSVAGSLEWGSSGVVVGGVVVLVVLVEGVVVRV